MGSTVGCRGNHGRPESKVDEAHALHLPPGHLWPFSAGKSKGVLAHCEVSVGTGGRSCLIPIEKNRRVARGWNKL